MSKLEHVESELQIGSELEPGCVGIRESYVRTFIALWGN